MPNQWDRTTSHAGFQCWHFQNRQAGHQCCLCVVASCVVARYRQICLNQFHFKHWDDLLGTHHETVNSDDDQWYQHMKNIQPAHISPPRSLVCPCWISTQIISCSKNEFLSPCDWQRQRITGCCWSNKRNHETISCFDQCWIGKTTHVMVQQNRKNCDWMTFRKYSATMWELQAELKISGHFSPQRSRRGTWYLCVWYTGYRCCKYPGTTLQGTTLLRNLHQVLVLVLHVNVVHVTQ